MKLWRERERENRGLVKNCLIRFIYKLVDCNYYYYIIRDKRSSISLYSVECSLSSI